MGHLPIPMGEFDHIGAVRVNSSKEQAGDHVVQQNNEEPQWFHGGWPLMSTSKSNGRHQKIYQINHGKNHGKNMVKIMEPW